MLRRPSHDPPFLFFFTGEIFERHPWSIGTRQGNCVRHFRTQSLPTKISTVTILGRLQGNAGNRKQRGTQCRPFPVTFLMGGGGGAEDDWFVANRSRSFNDGGGASVRLAETYPTSASVFAPPALGLLLRAHHAIQFLSLPNTTLIIPDNKKSSRLSRPGHNIHSVKRNTPLGCAASCSSHLDNANIAPSIPSFIPWQHLYRSVSESIKAFEQPF